MQLADVESVHAIDVLAFSLPWSERSYHFELTENKHSCLWVAEAVEPDGAGTVAGMIVIWVVLDEAHIATLAVHPDYRHAGIGRRLLAQGLLDAWMRGARLAYLEVRRSNQAAQTLYASFGFQVVGERPRYYKDNSEDALLMTLEHIQPEMIQPLVK
jgi:ribosomal-protein-alanine N-acetyltransferase